MLVGGDIRVNGRSRRVVGVQAATGFEDRTEPAFMVFAPIRSASALLASPPSGRFALSIQLRAATVESVDALREAAADWLSRRYARWQERVRVTAAAGLVLGFAIALLVTAAFRHWLGAPVHAVLSPTLVLIATLSCSVVGLVFGTYPARRAANLSPIAALAHE